MDGRAESRMRSPLACSVRQQPFPAGTGCEDVPVAPKSGRRFARAGGISRSKGARGPANP